jgi:hypothetical protein
MNKQLGIENKYSKFKKFSLKKNKKTLHFVIQIKSIALTNKTQKRKYLSVFLKTFLMRNKACLRPLKFEVRIKFHF